MTTSKTWRRTWGLMKVRKKGLYLIRKDFSADIMRMAVWFHIKFHVFSVSYCTVCRDGLQRLSIFKWSYLNGQFHCKEKKPAFRFYQHNQC